MPDKPRVLILIDWYLPGYRAGGPIQSTSNLVRALGQEIDFGVITCDTDHATETPYPDVVANTWLTRPEGTPVYYFSRDQLRLGRLRQLIHDFQPDYVYLNSMYSLPFTIWPWWLAWRGQLPGRLVLAPRGMLQAGAVQIKSLKKKVFLRLLHLTGLQNRIIWQATDAQEAEDIRHFFGPKVEVRLAANIPKQDQRPWQSPPKRPGQARFVFASRISRKKNIEFLLRLLPAVQGQIEVNFYGPYEDAAYRQQCETLIGQLPERIQARLCGPIPAPELPEKLAGHHFSVLTTQAENFGHAIFEGLLAGLPVLISDRTPWRGLAAQEVGWDLPLEEPEAFVRAIQQAVDMDQATYDRWSRQAWEYARAFKNDPALLAQSRALFA